jgi:transposase
MSDRFDHTLEHTLETKPGAGDGAVEFRRIELITGVGRRRKWPAAEKARILIESLEPGANVSDVARRNGVSPQQLFGWRREARALFSVGADEAGRTAPPAARAAPVPTPTTRRPKSPAGTTAEAPAFAQVVIAASPTAAPQASPPPADTSPPGTIEIGIGDAVVRISGEVQTSALIAVLRAVRRAS